MDSPPSAQINHQLLAAVEIRLRKLHILDELRQNVQDLKQTLDFICTVLDEYKMKTDVLETTFTKLETTVNQMKTESGQLKEKMLELTTRSMRDNLIFSGITESSGEEVEKTLKQFFINELQMDVEMVEKSSLIVYMGSNTSEKTKESLV